MKKFIYPLSGSGPAIRNDFKEANGTYILHWYKGDKPRGISRLLGNDCEGILYIGETTGPLYDRVSLLETAIRNNSKEGQPKPAESGHAQIGKKFYRIRRHIKLTDLRIEVIRCIEDPKKDESKLLEEYVAEFGELPPFNGNYGSEAYWSLF